MASLLFLALLALQPGAVVDDVKCAADATQSYALYLPSGYSPDRAWPVIFGFDPAGRGRNAVDRYQVAAERFGYIVAGSNNSRNGSLETGKAVNAMIGDVTAHFSVERARMYTAGMSGGSRVALGVALTSGKIAGVFASSAGYPDSKPRKTLPFPVFMTAGTEDFNHIEMREMDRELTSPHRLAIFEGGHVWLSSELAVQAVEWMELQAMRSGLKPRDQAEIDGIFAKRSGAAVDYSDVAAVAADFDGLRDVTAFAARAAAMSKDKAVRDLLKKERADDDREAALLGRFREAEAQLDSDERHGTALTQLSLMWKELADKAKKPGSLVERRVLSGLSMSVTSKDPDYLKIVRQYRVGRGGR